MKAEGCIHSQQAVFCCAADWDDESEEPPSEDHEYEEKLELPRRNLALLAGLFASAPLLGHHTKSLLCTACTASKTAPPCYIFMRMCVHSK